MNLFELTPNYTLQIDPIAYTLEPFAVLWDRDKTKNKTVAQKELAYIYFMCDYKSDFYNEPDPDRRKIEVIRHLFKDKKWEPDAKVRAAIDFYKERQKTFSLILLEDAVLGISKLSGYLRDINFEETLTDKSGVVKPKHDIKKYADTIKQIPAILTALKELQEAVKKEQESDNKLRGGRDKGMYADQ